MKAKLVDYVDWIAALAFIGLIASFAFIVVK